MIAFTKRFQRLQSKKEAGIKTGLEQLHQTPDGFSVATRSWRRGHVNRPWITGNGCVAWIGELQIHRHSLVRTQKVVIVIVAIAGGQPVLKGFL